MRRNCCHHRFGRVLGPAAPQLRRPATTVPIAIVPWSNRDESHRRMGTWPKVRPRRLRAVTMDVTGTVVSFRGTLQEHYLGAAQKCGVAIPPDLPIAPAFARAYREMSRTHPCFGGDSVTAKDWWRRCVERSFTLAGADMTQDQAEAVFQRIYSVFGSQAAYERFDDALPFLHWAQRRRIVCGILSNADERYGDSILPMLGITPDTLQFACFSKDLRLEKPDTRFYQAALLRAQACLERQAHRARADGGGSEAEGGDRNDRDEAEKDDDDTLLPSQILHIGNDYNKDFEGARRAGMHAVLLDRYNEREKAAEWRRRGAQVFNDLIDVVHWIGRSGARLG